MSPITCARLASLGALILAVTCSHAAVTSRIFASGFDNVSVPPSSAELNFVNQTRQRFDTIISTPMAYAFDALWTDFNNDGCYDAFVYNHAPPGQGQDGSRLWVNRCDGSHTFEYYSNTAVNYAIAQPSTAHASGWLTLLDANGDGLQDYWAWSADQHGAWLRNATPPGAHVPFFSTKLQACTDHCIFADINGDHKLDIVHTDRSVEGIQSGVEIVAASGAPEAEVMPADIDGDGWTDLLQPELGGYWHNEQGVLQWRETGLSGHAPHYAVADFNNDGHMDLFTLSDNDPTRLYRNDGNGNLVDVTAGSGLEGLESIAWWTGYGNTVAADLNNDGLQDLVIAGADRVPSVSIFVNVGGMTFVKASVDLGRAGGANAFKSRAAVADFDNDGRLDIIKTQKSTTAGIWRNTTAANSARWMKVRVRGMGLNTDGVGTDVKWYRHGTSTLVAHMAVQVGEMHPQTWLHTGLGANPTVDMVVSYPSGGPTYRFDGLSSNQEVIVFPNGCLIQHWQPGHGWPLTAPPGCGN